MASSVYILVSFIVYLFEIYPGYMHSKELPEQERFLTEQMWGKKAPHRYKKFEKVIFCIGTINLIICCVLLLLKLVGVIEWW